MCCKSAAEGLNPRGTGTKHLKSWKGIIIKAISYVFFLQARTVFALQMRIQSLKSMITETVVNVWMKQNIEVAEVMQMNENF